MHSVTCQKYRNFHKFQNTKFNKKKILDNKLCFTVMIKHVQEVNNFVTTTANCVYMINKKSIN